MGGEDWKIEARRLLADAVGVNDNASAKAAAGIHFHGPVTFNLNGDCSAATQRQALQDRLKGVLLAEGKNTTTAFHEELSRAYHKTDVGAFSDEELTDMLANFHRLIRIARVLGTIPKR